MTEDVKFTKGYESFYKQYPKGCLQNFNKEIQKQSELYALRLDFNI